MMISATAPRRPALRWYGSKWRLAKWVISHFPPHESYIEPYGGSAAVLLQKQRSWLEVYNDLDDEVITFFWVLREYEDELIRKIRYTPYSHAEWERSFEVDADLPAIERARRFYVRSWLSINGPTSRSQNGWRRQTVISRGRNGDKMMTPAAISFMQTDHLHAISERLRGVYIEQEDALYIIKRYDNENALFYLDPPYPIDTRARSGALYAREMSDQDHMALAFALSQIEGMAVVSGYRCDLYDYLYAHWQRVDKETRVNGPGSATESLWLSPRAVERRRHGDLPLFGSSLR